MSIAIWCVFCVFLMPYALTTLAKSGGAYDNHAPRAYLSKLTGWHARANYAQSNCYETFAPFAASVLFAQMNGLDQLFINQMAIAFVVVRILYSILYITDRAALRTVIFMLGFGINITLFIKAAMA